MRSPSAAKHDQYFSKMSFQFQACLPALVYIKDARQAARDVPVTKAPTSLRAQWRCLPPRTVHLLGYHSRVHKWLSANSLVKLPHQVVLSHTRVCKFCLSVRVFAPADVPAVSRPISWCGSPSKPTTCCPDAPGSVTADKKF